MNATNRPVDFFLNIENPSLNLTQRRNNSASNNQGAELSALNRKENSFETVYREQHRKGSEVRQSAQQKRSADQPARAEHRSSQAQQNTPAKQTKAESKTSSDGKSLPHVSPNNHGQQVSMVAKRDGGDVTAGDEPLETLALIEDVELAASFDVTEVASVDNAADDIAAIVAAAQQNAELSVETETEQEITVEINSDLLANADTGSDDEFDGDEAQQTMGVGLDVKLAEKPDTSQADEQQSAQIQPSTSEAQAMPDAEAAVQQFRQTETGAQSAEGDSKARVVQSSAATAEVARDFKQSRLGDAMENTIKGDAATAIQTKGATSVAEQGGQPPQDRLAQLTAAMDFKALREQIAAGKVKVDSATGGVAKGASLDALGAADGTADRQPRLNALTQTSQSLTQVKPGTVTASVQQPVGSSEWGQAMSQRIMWLANRGISAAELQLNPRDLGPVDVRINVTGEHATVQFTSQNAAVREALESSVVRLREMLEASGLNLADVDVSDHSQSEQAQRDAGDRSARVGADENDEMDAVAETVITQRIESDGLVDFYA